MVIRSILIFVLLCGHAEAAWRTELPKRPDIDPKGVYILVERADRVCLLASLRDKSLPIEVSRRHCEVSMSARPVHFEPESGRCSVFYKDGVRIILHKAQMYTLEPLILRLEKRTHCGIH